MITVAPEAVSLDQIREMAEIGVIVSLGHTDATAEQAMAAFQAGAGCVTHLFNAMSQIQNRAPGVVGAAINSDVYAGIICDGHHVADSLVGMAIRARPVPDRMFLVSDAMPTVGGSPAFTLYGQTISLDNGRLVNNEGSLAGAHVTMFQAVRRLVSHTGTSLETALRMGTSIPRAVLKGDDTPSRCLTGRSVDDILVLKNDLSGFHFLSQTDVIHGHVAI
jgi:N-acetylglucosamine-6-phosphate deacetylase